MNFFDELKRRNVFRVGIAYGVASWLLLQVADLVFPRIGIDDSVITIMIAVLGIGFIPALVFAWAFEMTPQGLRREAEVDRKGSITHHTAKKLDYITLAALAGVVVLVLMNRQPAIEEGSEPFSERTAQNITNEALKRDLTPEAEKGALTPASPATDSDRKSVAVLPFDFRSSNPEDEFFAEGMHDDLLTQLAKIGSLKVISRTSVMEYKETTKKIPEIARELGVATIVEGGVQRSGSRMRINAQLIDAQTDEHLWAETYNRELTAENLFEVQAEISRAIAHALQATLSPAEEAQIGQVLTNNLEAWESYQRAMRWRLSQEIEAIPRAQAETAHAVELDPTFAAAMGLHAIVLLQQYWFYDPDPALRDRAWSWIERGRKLSPDLAELDVAEAYYYYWGYLDYANALVALDRALIRMPNNARVHEARAYVLRRQGNWDGAIAGLQRSIELDPRNGLAFADLADTLAGVKRYQEAEDFYRQAMRLEPDNSTVLSSYGQFTWRSSGNLPEARRYVRLAQNANAEAGSDYWMITLSERDFEEALRIIDRWPEDMLNTRAYGFTRDLLRGLTLIYAGQKQQGRELLTQEERRFEALVAGNPGDFTAAQSLCLIKGGLGKTDEASRVCNAAISILPNDAFLAGDLHLQLVIGLAESGDQQGAIDLATRMLKLDVSPGIYPLLQHPAFDELQQNPDFIALIEKHRVQP